MINIALENLYFEDKKEREAATTQERIDTLETNTKNRLKQLDQLIPRVDTKEIWNCHYIAYLLQHGNCPEDFRLAHEYAKKAVDMGSCVTKWLYAATLDRYLISIGRLQKYGTQYQIVNGEKIYAPTDGTITETEKIEHGVEPTK